MHSNKTFTPTELAEAKAELYRHKARCLQEAKPEAAKVFNSLGDDPYFQRQWQRYVNKTWGSGSATKKQTTKAYSL